MSTRWILPILLPAWLACGAPAGGDAAPATNTSEVLLERDFNEEEALARGAEVAAAAGAALMATLSEAIAAGGAAHAVEVCNVAALPLVDPLSRAHGVRIKRTSALLRAPHDAPDELEREWLQRFARQHAEGGTMGAVAMRHGADSVAFHAPIFIAGAMCLHCHGGAERDPDAVARIGELYPDDQAVGYALGDLRGMWSIRWPL